MANALYNKGREAFLNGGINWSSDDIRVILIDAADYTVNLATHDFLNDVPAPARVATSSALTGKTSTDGVANAGAVTFTAVTGDQSEAVIIYKHTGVESTSTLIAYIDTATGLPITPSGGNITITWDSGANKIFKL
jgi:hypothetical protein